MHVFIDDSGDGGFKFGLGSSSHLIMAACVFRDAKEIERLAACAERCKYEMSHHHELKYSNCREKVRDRFFECISDTKFSVRTIVIDKAVIHSPKLRSDPAALKSYAIRQLLTKNYGQVRGAKILIDGQDTKAFGVDDKQYLARMVNQESPGTVGHVTFVDSRTNVGIQLADMIAGAVNRAVRTDRPSDTKHFETFVHRTYQPEGSFWRFK